MHTQVKHVLHILHPPQKKLSSNSIHEFFLYMKPSDSLRLEILKYTKRISKMKQICVINHRTAFKGNNICAPTLYTYLVEQSTFMP